jgi:hypothetical protein
LTIKFVCSCGKHLKARDEMASRRSVCPRCGSPVGIPALKAGPPAAAAPRTMPRPDRAASAASPVVDTRVVRLLSGRGQHRPDRAGRHLEEHWYECLWYPLRAWHLCVGLAGVLTVLSAGVAFFLPRVLLDPPADPWSLAMLRLLWAMLLVLILGVPCSFLDLVLASAAGGETRYIRWSGDPLLTFLVSGLRWLACFLTGPVVFAAAAVLYWRDCGDPAVLDWLIITELAVVAIAYQAFVLLAVTDRGRLRDLNPLAVADLAHRLGWRAMAAVLVAACLALGHGLALAAGITGIHTAAATGWLILAAAWVSGVYWSTFFCRLLGVWCYRSRRAAQAAVVAVDLAGGLARRCGEAAGKPAG